MNQIKLSYFFIALPLILLISTLSSSVYTQSVDHFIELANSQNHGLKASKLMYESALYQADQLGDYPDPIVSLGIGVLPIETRLGAQRFRIGIQQAIPWKGLLEARQNASRAMAESKSFETEIKAIDIEYSIRNAYSALVFLKESQLILLNKLEILDILEILATSAVNSGKGKLSNVLMIQRQREAIEADLLLLEKSKENPSITINRWCGRAMDSQIIIEKENLLNNNKDALIAFATQQHPQIKYLESMVTASQSAAKLTQFESKPKIGLGLDYSYIDSRPDVVLAGNGRDVLMPMGSVSIPFHNDRFEAKRQEEKLKQQASAEMAEDMRQMFTSEIAKAQSAIEYAEMNITKMENQKLITQSTLELMRTEYASEGTRFEELLRLEMDLIDYDLNILKSIYDIDIAKAKLKKYE